MENWGTVQEQIERERLQTQEAPLALREQNGYIKLKTEETPA